jgi:hypothetical protein
MTNVQELERAFVATITGLNEHDAGVLIEFHSDVGERNACSVPRYAIEQQGGVITDGLPSDHPYGDTPPRGGS